MSFNYGREEKKWRLWKEAEEKQLRDLGVAEAVSYTHLDVYKRQISECSAPLGIPESRRRSPAFSPAGFLHRQSWTEAQ